MLIDFSSNNLTGSACLLQSGVPQPATVTGIDEENVVYFLRGGGDGSMSGDFSKFLAKCPNAKEIMDKIVKERMNAERKAYPPNCTISGEPITLTHMQNTILITVWSCQRHLIS